jgi:hypothetical protein
VTNLEILNGNLQITVEGMDRIWSLKSHLTIPMQHIVDVSYRPEIAHGWWHGMKLPGSFIPGVLTAGTFYQHGEFTFWDVHNPDKTVVITLHDETYGKLVIEVENPEATIAHITAALKM